MLHAWLDTVKLQELFPNLRDVACGVRWIGSLADSSSTKPNSLKWQRALLVLKGNKPHTKKKPQKTKNNKPKETYLCLFYARTVLQLQAEKQDEEEEKQPLVPLLRRSSTSPVTG